MSPKQHFGKRWEQRLVNELAHRGISANHASDDNWLSEFDIEAEGLLVHWADFKGKGRNWRIEGERVG